MCKFSTIKKCCMPLSFLTGPSCMQDWPFLNNRFLLSPLLFSWNWLYLGALYSWPILQALSPYHKYMQNIRKCADSFMKVREFLENKANMQHLEQHFFPKRYSLMWSKFCKIQHDSKETMFCSSLLTTLPHQKPKHYRWNESVLAQCFKQHLHSSEP